MGDEITVEATRELWNRKATFWDERFGAEGNDWHQKLVTPAVENLLAVTPGESVLEVACGNGALARRLAEQGADVLACDFSPVFIERARERTPASLGVRYTVADATDEKSLLALGGPFDAAVATMALMDMVTIEPLARALAQILRPGGRFVFAVSHPCFNTNGVCMEASRVWSDGEESVATGIKVTRYLDIPPALNAGMPGEPNPHYYFDRPLHALLAPFFAAGLLLDGLLEPAFPGGGAPLTWNGMPQIPPVLAARLRHL